MEDGRQERGEWGERFAARYLQREKGMRVLERRWRQGHGELDLVMRQGRVVVFVEVRVRSGAGAVMAPYHGIRRHKWRVLRRTAAGYLRQCGWRPAGVRFDVVGIRLLPGGVPDLVHWENVGAFGRNFRW